MSNTNIRVHLPCWFILQLLLQHFIVWIVLVAHNISLLWLKEEWMNHLTVVCSKEYVYNLLLHNIYMYLHAHLILYNDWFLPFFVDMDVHEELLNGCISYFASCMTKNDCSLLVFMSQKVSQTANVPVVTNTSHSSKFNIWLYLFGLSFIFSATAPVPGGPAPGGPAPVGPAPEVLLQFHLFLNLFTHNTNVRY